MMEGIKETHHDHMQCASTQGSTDDEANAAQSHGRLAPIFPVTPQWP